MSNLYILHLNSLKLKREALQKLNYILSLSLSLSMFHPSLFTNTSDSLSEMEKEALSLFADPAREEISSPLSLLPSAVVEFSSPLVWKYWLSKEIILLSFDPLVKKIPWSRKWHPALVFLPENSVDKVARWATVPGITKSRTQLSYWGHHYMKPATDLIFKKY